jgi:hypothetical protein
MVSGSASSAPCGTFHSSGSPSVRSCPSRQSRGSRPACEARNDALLDGLLQLDVRVAAPSVPGPDRRETSHQRRAQVHRRARRAQAERLLQHLVVPDRLVIRMKQDVRVASMRPGSSVRPGRSRAVAPETSTLAAGPTCSMRSPRAHNPALVQSVAIEHTRGAQQEHIRWHPGGLLGRGDRRKCEQSGKRSPGHVRQFHWWSPRAPATADSTCGTRNGLTG